MLNQDYVSEMQLCICWRK